MISHLYRAFIAVQLCRLRVPLSHSYRASTRFGNLLRSEPETRRCRKIPSTGSLRTDRIRIWEHQVLQETGSIIFRCLLTDTRHGIGRALQPSPNTSAAPRIHSVRADLDTCSPIPATVIAWNMSPTRWQTNLRSTAPLTSPGCPTLAATVAVSARMTVNVTASQIMVIVVIVNAGNFQATTNHLPNLTKIQ